MNFYHEFRKSLQNVGILIAKMNNLKSMQPELDTEKYKDTDSAEAEPLEIIKKEVNNNIYIKILTVKPEDDFDYSDYVSMRLMEIRENCKIRDLRAALELFEVPYQREYFE